MIHLWQMAHCQHGIPEKKLMVFYSFFLLKIVFLYLLREPFMCLKSRHLHEISDLYESYILPAIVKGMSGHEAIKKETWKNDEKLLQSHPILNKVYHHNEPASMLGHWVFYTGQIYLPLLENYLYISKPILCLHSKWIEGKMLGVLPSLSQKCTKIQRRKICSSS